MAIDLTLYLDDQPGELARLSTALGAGGVNVEGFFALAGAGGQAEVHLLVEDAEAAFTALAKGGFEAASEQEVFVVGVADRPGGLGEITRRLGDAQVGITSAYLATRTRLVIAADDLAAARAVLESTV